MTPLPTLEELTALTTAEIAAVIRVNIPPEWVLKVEASKQGMWSAEILDDQGEVVFTYSYPDERLTLLSAFGFVWKRQYKPSSPVWQRKRHDLRSPGRQGIMHLPGADSIPDPGDFDPLSVYDPDPDRRSR